MIPNQWYVILDSQELKKKNQLVGVTRLGEKLVLWRDENNKVHCLYDKCAHRGAALSAGKIVHGEVQCPFHGLQYDSTGRCTIIPSRGEKAPVPSNFRVNSYTCREAHGFIWIWWGDVLEKTEYPEIPWFDDLDDSFSYGTKKDRWQSHYSRCIENQLDVSHLWIVHQNTIGRGNRKVCDGPVVELDDNTHIERIWVMNRTEDGTPSKLPKEIDKPEKEALLHFIFPHIWQNKIAEKIRIMIAFVPINEENTILYMRFYQKFVNIPILSTLMNKMGLWGSKIIAHQDRRVVETQVPKKTSLKMDENLYPADLPIVVYRRMREQLKNKSR
ncbi:MAG: Rieske 2Fe-2S domain-containing protein [Candidatus Lokiarchaeota archaeon]|nr:Rieske 2Fe-2S domain-containing protein [Candidatus Lokiarchaeota archaeon]